MILVVFLNIIQIQVLLGNHEGTYFLDDFETSIEDTGILSNTTATLSKQEVNLYPNPASDLLYINAKNTSKISVSIYDILGVKILKKDIDNNESVDISSLENAVYFALIESDNFTKTITFIKKD